MKRRGFIKKSSALSLFLGIPILNKNDDLKKKQINGVFKHHVYFWLKEPKNKEGNALFLKNLTGFLEECDMINSVHIGKPANTPREVVDNSYTYDLLVTFDDKKEQDAYQEHEAHKRFVNETAHLWTKVQVYDSIELAKY
jgi:hypothetical protein